MVLGSELLKSQVNVKEHQRRTASGGTTTVKAHTMTVDKQGMIDALAQHLGGHDKIPDHEGLHAAVDRALDQHHETGGRVKHVRYEGGAWRTSNTKPQAEAGQPMIHIGGGKAKYSVGGEVKGHVPIQTGSAPSAGPDTPAGGDETITAARQKRIDSAKAVDFKKVAKASDHEFAKEYHRSWNRMDDERMDPWNHSGDVHPAIGDTHNKLAIEAAKRGISVHATRGNVANEYIKIDKDGKHTNIDRMGLGVEPHGQPMHKPAAGTKDAGPAPGSQAASDGVDKETHDKNKAAAARTANKRMAESIAKMTDDDLKGELRDHEAQQAQREKLNPKGTITENGPDDRHLALRDEAINRGWKRGADGKIGPVAKQADPIQGAVDNGTTSVHRDEDEAMKHAQQRADETGKAHTVYDHEGRYHVAPKDDTHAAAYAAAGGKAQGDIAPKSHVGPTRYAKPGEEKPSEQAAKTPSPTKRAGAGGEAPSAKQLKHQLVRAKSKVDQAQAAYTENPTAATARALANAKSKHAGLHRAHLQATGEMENPKPGATGGDKDATLEAIAKEHLGLETLKPRNSDSLDFKEHGVHGIKRALLAAHKAGGGKGDGEAIASKVAKEHLGIDTLKARNSDSLDFKEQGVHGIKRALEAAHAAGASGDAAGTPKPKKDDAPNPGAEGAKPKTPAVSKPGADNPETRKLIEAHSKAMHAGGGAYDEREALENHGVMPIYHDDGDSVSFHAVDPKTHKLGDAFASHGASNAGDPPPKVEYHQGKDAVPQPESVESLHERAKYETALHHPTGSDADATHLREPKKPASDSPNDHKLAVHAEVARAKRTGSDAAQVLAHHVSHEQMAAGKRDVVRHNAHNWNLRDHGITVKREGEHAVYSKNGKEIARLRQTEHDSRYPHVRGLSDEMLHDEHERMSTFAKDDDPGTNYKGSRDFLKKEIDRRKATGNYKPHAQREQRQQYRAQMQREAKAAEDQGFKKLSDHEFVAAYHRSWNRVEANKESLAQDRIHGTDPHDPIERAHRKFMDEGDRRGIHANEVSHNGEKYYDYRIRARDSLGQPMGDREFPLAAHPVGRPPRSAKEAQKHSQDIKAKKDRRDAEARAEHEAWREEQARKRSYYGGSSGGGGASGGQGGTGGNRNGGVKPTTNADKSKIEKVKALMNSPNAGEAAAARAAYERMTKAIVAYKAAVVGGDAAAIASSRDELRKSGLVTFEKGGEVIFQAARTNEELGRFTPPMVLAKSLAELDGRFHNPGGASDHTPQKLRNGYEDGLKAYDVAKSMAPVARTFVHFGGGRYHVSLDTAPGHKHHEGRGYVEIAKGGKDALTHYYDAAGGHHQVPFAPIHLGIQ